MPHLKDVTREVPMSQLVNFTPRVVDGRAHGPGVVNVDA
jgi:hypothetical protein